MLRVRRPFFHAMIKRSMHGDVRCETPDKGRGREMKRMGRKARRGDGEEGIIWVPKR